MTNEVTSNGVNYNTTDYTYSEWTALLHTFNYPNYNDYLYNGPPENFRVLVYNNIQSGEGLLVEIYGYANTTAAGSEFNKQYGTYTVNVNVGGVGVPKTACCKEGLIFQRWSGPQGVLQRAQFMVFIVVPSANPTNDTLAQSTLTDFTQRFTNSLFTTIPEGTQPPPPPAVNFTGTVVWGVRPGDRLSWLVNSTTISGSVGEGGGVTKDTYNITMEIVQIGADNLSILIKSPITNAGGSYWSTNFPDFEYAPEAWHPPKGQIGCGYYECDLYTGTSYAGSDFFLNLTLPTFSYFWENATSMIGGNGSPYPLIFPVYRNGNLQDVISSEISGLQYSQGAGYISGSYSTPATPGSSPSVSQDEQITVHEGSGIATSGSFYYQNRDLSETRSTSLRLVSVSFDLNSRLPATIQSSSSSSVASTTSSSSVVASLSTSTSVTTTQPQPLPVPGDTYLVAAVLVVVVGVGFAISQSRRRHKQGNSASPPLAAGGGQYYHPRGTELRGARCWPHRTR
ncbi:MAG: hypothetical protein ABSG45_02220 [Nitrososphaerales archaeon]